MRISRCSVELLRDDVRHDHGIHMARGEQLDGHDFVRNFQLHGDERAAPRGWQLEQLLRLHPILDQHLLEKLQHVWICRVQL